MLENKISVIYFQHQGKKVRQEDSCFISKDKKLFAVFDGVGGSENGFIASQTAKKLLNEWYEKLDAEVNTIHIKDAIDYISNGLSKHNHQYVATTMALVFVENSKALISKIGDSRIFYMSPSKSKWWVSKDDSIVQELFDAGILSSEEEMKNHPFKNRITKALSSKNVIDINDIKVQQIIDINKGDIFALFTDGVLEKFTNKQSIEILGNVKLNFQEKVEYFNLVSSDSKDNSTAVFVLIM
ncbi:MAG TPA: protein phosphatase 2C domain-containing protein [Saprospiraceae bacterium]|nr:protein phosphatase 2C domain-containing protein [Saprospiraceae bacterium]